VVSNQLVFTDLTVVVAATFVAVISRRVSNDSNRRLRRLSRPVIVGAL
jgi:hypothetical protein